VSEMSFSQEAEELSGDRGDFIDIEDAPQPEGVNIVVPDREEIEGEFEEVAEVEEVAEIAPEAIVEELAPVEEPIADSTTGIMIPKSRLDDVLAKNRQLQNQLDQRAPAADPANPTAPPLAMDIDDSYAAVQQAILNDDGESGKQAMVNLLNASNASLRQEMTGTIESSQKQVLESMQYEATYTGFKTQYDVLDENSPNFSADVEDQIREVRDGYILQDYTPRDALTKAVGLVMKPLLMGSAVTPAVTPAAVTRKTGNDISHVDVAAKVATAASQPGELNGVTNGATEYQELDMDTMSQKDFDALPMSIQRRLRGDEL